MIFECFENQLKPPNLWTYVSQYAPQIHLLSYLNHKIMRSTILLMLCHWAKIIIGYSFGHQIIIEIVKIAVLHPFLH